jgi:hypothetical protein
VPSTGAVVRPAGPVDGAAILHPHIVRLEADVAADVSDRHRRGVALVHDIVLRSNHVPMSLRQLSVMVLNNKVKPC